MHGGIPSLELADRPFGFVAGCFSGVDVVSGGGEFRKGDADFEVFDLGGEVFLLAVAFDVNAVGFLFFF
jgi:hypothetical protein